MTTFLPHHFLELGSPSPINQSCRMGSTSTIWFGCLLSSDFILGVRRSGHVVEESSRILIFPARTATAVVMMVV